jgi:glutathione S-transferase
MPEFTLHCFLESGNAYKAALMLSLCDADWEARRVAFFVGETRSPEFRARNVMGEVPVLVHHRVGGDLTISQSGVILTHLSRRFDRFGPKSDTEEYEILRWLLWDNHKLTSYTGTSRFLGYFQKKTDDPVTKFFETRAANAWKILDTHLSGREWIVSDRPTIADLSVCGYLFWPDQIGMNRSEYPAITAWLERIAALPGYARPEALMPTGLETSSATA